MQQKQEVAWWWKQFYQTGLFPCSLLFPLLLPVILKKQGIFWFPGMTAGPAVVEFRVHFQLVMVVAGRSQNSNYLPHIRVIFGPFQGRSLRLQGKITNNRERSELDLRRFVSRFPVRSPRAVPLTTLSTVCFSY